MENIIDAAEQILAHVRGEIELESYYFPGPVDVKAIRKKTGLSQAQFAQRFALSLRTLQQWEQGKQSPDSAVRAYLTVIDRNPAAVVEALPRLTTYPGDGLTAQGRSLCARLYGGPELPDAVNRGARPRAANGLGDRSVCGKMSTRKKRPVLDQMMEDVRLKRTAVVLVWKLDQVRPLNAGSDRQYHAPRSRRRPVHSHYPAHRQRQTRPNGEVGSPVSPSGVVADVTLT
jgi:putative transcriptional regulator